MLDPALAAALDEICYDLYIDVATQQYWALPQNRDWLIQRMRSIQNNLPSSPPIKRKRGESSSGLDLYETSRIGLGMR